jgi:hypothetical protein
VEEIWEIKVARRIRRKPQNRQKQKKIQKRKNKGTCHFPEIIKVLTMRRAMQRMILIVLSIPLFLTDCFVRAIFRLKFGSFCRL